MTEKENWKRMHEGQMPAFLPKYDMMNWNVMCSLMMGGGDKKMGDGKTFTDIFGVEFVPTKETAGGPIPVPGKFILDDIRKWRDVIRVPDLSNIDWEALAKNDLKDKDVENIPILVPAGGGLFQNLMSFMGFTEGMCAMVEEPEEVIELFAYINDFTLEVEKNMIRYYKPDGFSIGDDNSTALNPFISPMMYREMIKPFNKILCDTALNSGLYIQMHDCGRCEDFIDDWLDLGITSWDPAQVSNDLKKIKEKVGRKLIICGCWDTSGPASWLHTDDQVLKDALVAYIDTFAPGGGFAYGPYVMGAIDDENATRKMKIIDDFYLDYARDYYQTHQ